MNTAIRTYAEKVSTFAAADFTVNDLVQTAFTLPKLNEYNFYLNILTMTGASQTQDIELQVTPDSGTTWLTIARFTQVVVATKLSQRIRFRPIMGPGDVPSTTPDLTTGSGGIVGTGAFVGNCPIPGTTSNARFRFLAGGTFTTLTGNIWLVGNVAEGEGY